MFLSSRVDIFRLKIVRLSTAIVWMWLNYIYFSSVPSTFFSNRLGGCFHSMFYSNVSWVFRKFSEFSPFSLIFSLQKVFSIHQRIFIRGWKNWRDAKTTSTPELQSSSLKRSTWNVCTSCNSLDSLQMIR